MKKLIVGNWKMNGSIKLVDEFILRINKQAILALPSIFISYVHFKNPELRIAAQDCSIFDGFGAHTGEISAQMLADAGCEYVIIGHSERRKTSNFDAMPNILKKLHNVVECGMTVVLCVDEGYAELIDKSIADILKNHPDKVVIAYEPISAIGTGKVPSLTDISNVLSNIKKNYFGIRTLYGGSVNSDNIKDILSIASVDGVLIGGASLKVEELNKICEISTCLL